MYVLFILAALHYILLQVNYYPDPNGVPLSAVSRQYDVSYNRHFARILRTNPSTGTSYNDQLRNKNPNRLREYRPARRIMGYHWHYTVAHDVESIVQTCKKHTFTAMYRALLVS